MNKKDFVYEQIRTLIISCEIQPGAPVNEAAFAEQFNVSKTPIREAIRQLEREGLVVSIPGRGSIISYISSGDIFATFEIREIIECGAARLAALHDNKEKIIMKRDELQEIKETLEDDSKPALWTQYNDLHTEIIDSIHNGRLSRMYREILDNITRIRNNFGFRFSGRRLDHIIDEHLVILNAIIDGDADAAQTKVREHLRNASAYLNSLI